MSSTRALEKAGFSEVSVNAIRSDELDRPAKRPHNSVLSLRKVRRDLGLKPRPWQEGAQEFVAELMKDLKVL